MTKREKQNYDVVISGGGMVGLVAALSLSNIFDRVLLIERGEKPVFDLTGERQLRVSAMADKHWQWFDTLGMAGYFDGYRLGPYKHMSVWDNRSDAELDFTQSGEKLLGNMVENNHVVYAATEALLKQERVDVRYQTEIASYEGIGRQVRIELSGGDEITAGLLVSAEGATSPIRQKAGISTKQSDYGQHGMVCFIKLDKAMSGTAYQAFNPTGPVGLLPMSNQDGQNEGVFSIVWSMSEEQVPMWLDCDEQKFCHGLKAHINRDLGMPELLSKRVAFPLRKQQASDYVKGRVVLVGDAAHVVHPLAGQGVNLGLADAACLADLLTALMDGGSLKDADALARKLKKYQRMRKSKVAESLLMIDVIHHLFTKQTAPLPLLRATGMKWVNRINPLKSWLMAQAGS